MLKDPFGNLMEWGQVLERLEQFERKGMLGACQEGMIRILRYKDNWRLREEVLKRVGAVDSPSDDLVAQVLSLVEDESVYYEARIMALIALERLVKEHRYRPERTVAPDRSKCASSVLKGLLAIRQPPIFANALLTCLNSLENPAREKHFAGSAQTAI